MLTINLLNKKKNNMVTLHTKAITIFGIVITTKKNIEKSKTTFYVNNCIEEFADEYMKRR